MRVVALVLLVGHVWAVELPAPKVGANVAGGLEISMEDIPGVSYKHIKYTLNNHVSEGAFHQAVDGRWYHRNQAVSYLEGTLDYTITARLGGLDVTVTGTVVEAPKAASALSAPVRRAGQVVLRDDFTGSSLNTAHWRYEVSAYGGFNGEFQVYTNAHENVYVRDGKLFIRPTFTADKLGHDFQSKTMDVKALWGTCTQAGNSGCYRTGTNIPPIMSGKITSHEEIRFGRAEIKAKTPCGDWIWPALWMLPRSNHYGSWPRSGEIDIMESRGNAESSGHGNTHVSSTLHWGTDGGNDRYGKTHGGADGSFCQNFHTWILDWTIDHIRVTVDGHESLNIPTPPGGFWSLGGFHGSNIWGGGTKMAPFDHHFYFIMNVAVGGTNGYFPTNLHYHTPKPWNDHSSTAKADFWKHHDTWGATWHGEDVAMQVDYIEMVQY